jgi:hypothetical protein
VVVAIAGNLDPTNERLQAFMQTTVQRDCSAFLDLDSQAVLDEESFRTTK